MAVKHISGGGADIWRVSKKGSPIVIDVNLKQIEQCMKRCKDQLPKIRAKSWSRAVGTLHKQLISAIRSGGNPEKGVPKFKDWDAFTKELRKARGWKKRDHRMGGVLADENRIVAFQRGNFLTGTVTQVFGWPDALANWAVKFQDGGDNSGYAQMEDKSWRHYVHKLGVPNIPHEYVRNPRPVLEPFRKYAIAKIDEWATAMVRKKMAAMIARNTRKALAV